MSVPLSHELFSATVVVEVLVVMRNVNAVKNETIISLSTPENLLQGSGYFSNLNQQ